MPRTSPSLETTVIKIVATNTSHYPLSTVYENCLLSVMNLISDIKFTMCVQGIDVYKGQDSSKAKTKVRF